MCAVPDCDRAVFSREWCQMHYTRWLRHGDPLISRSTRGMSIAERVERFIDRTDPSGCWLWTGAKNAAGYGMYHMGPGTRLVHRALYQQEHGPLPDDVQLDHLCRVRHCVNPAHLEPVTNRENWIRGESSSAMAVKTDRCKRGHDLTVHGYTRKDKPGRNCVACQRETRRAREARRRADVR